MSRSHSLQSVLTVDVLRSYAGSKSFARGEEYQASGLVENLHQSGSRITAIVHGSDEYEVSLRVVADSLEYSCSCPFAEDGNFCKHCVAVGLEWLELDSEEPEQDDNIRSYLERLDKQDLVEILSEHMCFDRSLFQKLSIRAAAAAENGVDFKNEIDRAMKSRIFIDYYEMRSYAQGANEIIDQIEEMLGKKSAERVVELSEHALKATEHTLDNCDDSDGYMNGIMERLQGIHLEACKMWSPEPLALAKHLFEWEIRSDWEIFYQAASTYQEVLGESGLTEYRRLAELEWANIPALGPRDKDDRDSKRFRATAMMEAIARAGGDLDQLAEIHKRDLRLPYHFLQVAQIYGEMGRTDLAIEWASKGAEIFAEEPDHRLVSFLADQYEKSGDEYRAMQVEWELFAKSPCPQRYPHLKERAERLAQWELWRPRAIGAVRDLVTKNKATNSGGYFRADHSELVSIYLWEGDTEAAWREAQEGGCSPYLLLRIAEAREELHPEDVVPIYKAHVESLVQRTNNGVYGEAVSVVQRIRKLAPAEEFEKYLADLRARYKAKRNLMKLLAGFAPARQS